MQKLFCSNKERNKQIYNSFLIFVLCLLLSFIYLFICSPNSPIYVFNDIHDTNWFITMGRGVLNGQVPYKDLFEQKGPLLFLIYAVCCLFKDVNIGIFVLELIVNCLFLFVSYKILKHFLNNFLSIVGVLLVAFVTYTSFYRVLGGGTVEELCLPIITYMLLVFLQFFDNNKRPTALQNTLNGAGLAFMFWTKFSILTTVVPLFLAYFIICIVKKQYKQMFVSIAIMLAGGVALTTLPVSYLAINKALPDMLHTYIYLNIFAYNSKVNILSNIYKYFKYGPIVVAITFVGFGILVFSKKSKIKWVVPSVYLASMVMLFLQKGFKYYYISLIPFMVVGVACFLDKIKIKYPTKIARNLAVSMILVVTLICSCFMSYTTSDIFKKETDYPQLVVAKQIKYIAENNNIKSPTLFCYKMWDYGFYTTTNILPVTKFFVNNVISEESFPDMYQSFHDTIETAKTDFVITLKDVYLKEVDFLTKNYSYYQEYAYEQNSPYKDVKLNFVLLVKSVYVIS